MTTINARMFLWLGLVMALYINYDTYERDFAPRLPPPPTATEIAQAAAPTAPGAPSRIRERHLKKSVTRKLPRSV